MLTKLPSLAAPELVILIVSVAASDENFIDVMTFPFQYSYQHYAYMYAFSGKKNLSAAHSN